MKRIQRAQVCFAIALKTKADQSHDLRCGG
jgi:hypothetical protein